MTKHVAVLMGGWSAERDVSLRSGKACSDALERCGYRVSRVDVGRDIEHASTAISLQCIQGRGHHADEVARRRMGKTWRPGQQCIARLHRH